MSEVENKPAKAKVEMVTVQILEMRGVPASGGVFLQSHEGLKENELLDGKKPYEKLKPGQSQEMLKSDYDGLPDATKELLRVNV